MTSDLFYVLRTSFAGACRPTLQKDSKIFSDIADITVTLKGRTIYSLRLNLAFFQFGGIFVVVDFGNA